MTTSSAPLRIGAFLAGLAMVFGAAFGVGRLVGPLDVAEAEHGGGAGQHVEETSHAD